MKPKKIRKHKKIKQHENGAWTEPKNASFMGNSDNANDISCFLNAKKYMRYLRKYVWLAYEGIV
jgi:hypothetical protein